MPNAAARRVRKAQTQSATTTHEDGPTVMSTLTAGDYTIETLGNDYEFTRAGAGRKREPSVFDNTVEDLVGKGTQRIPNLTSEAQANDVVKQLQKACEFRNRGLEKRIENVDDEYVVVFRVNEEKAKRAPRKPKAEGEVDASAVDSAETE